MGLINTGTTTEFKIYLTEYGKQRMLENSFQPTSFAVGDSDANYLSNLNITNVLPDMTGDYNDNVFSIYKNLKIKSKIIR